MTSAFARSRAVHPVEPAASPGEPVPAPRDDNNGFIFTAFHVLVWYVASIGLVLFNKWTFSPKPHGAGLPFPITLTGFNLAALSLASLATCRFLGYEAKDVCGPSWPAFLATTVPIAFFSAGDIALTNTAFVYLNASFVEMVKPSFIIFVLLLSMWMGLLMPSWEIIAAVALMVGGQVLISEGASEFSAVALLAVLFASVLAACRCVLIERILHARPAGRRMTSLEVIAYCMPWAVLMLALAMLLPYKNCADVCRRYPEFCAPDLDFVVPDAAGQLLGGAYVGRSPAAHRERQPRWCSEMALLLNASVPPAGVAYFVGVMLLASVIAFALTVNEFLLIGRLSALGVGAAGVVKIVLMYIATTETFHETTGPLQVAGLTVALTGVCLYYYKVCMGTLMTNFCAGCVGYCYYTPAGRLAD